jgi:hypothetical protein
LLDQHLLKSLAELHPITHKKPSTSFACLSQVQSHVAGMERDTVHRVKMFGVITVAYFVFWGPLFVATLLEKGPTADPVPSPTHGITLHIAFVHAIVNPLLFLALHAGLRHAIADTVCCACCILHPGAVRSTSSPRVPGYHFR